MNFRFIGLIVTLFLFLIIGIILSFKTITQYIVENNIPTIYREIDKKIDTFQFNSATAYIEKAKILLAERTALKNNFSTETARQKIYFNTMLADRILIAYYFKYGPREADLLFNYSTDNYSPDNIKPYDLKPYDIIISRDETLSSQLLLFRSQYSERYSHTDVIIPSADKRNLKAYTTDVEGGVIREDINEIGEVRDLILTYKDSTARELFFNRQKLANYIDNFERKISYNYPLIPNCTNELFCTEFVYCLFKDAGLQQTLNPYPRRLWNTNIKNSQLFSLYQGVMPEPSDILLNPNYKIVSEKINIYGLLNSMVADYIIQIFLTKLKYDLVFKYKFENWLQSITKTNLNSEIKKYSTVRINNYKVMLFLPRMDPEKVSPGLIVFSYRLSGIVYYLNTQKLLNRVSQKDFKFESLNAQIFEIFDEFFTETSY